MSEKSSKLSKKSPTAESLKNLNRSGRKKGTTNKSTRKYGETLEAANFDPAAAAMAMFHDPDVSHDIKLRLLQMMTEFSAYKPKPPVEIEPAKDLPPEPPKEISPEERMNLIKLASIGS